MPSPELQLPQQRVGAQIPLVIEVPSRPTLQAHPWPRGALPRQPFPGGIRLHPSALMLKGVAEVPHALLQKKLQRRSSGVGAGAWALRRLTQG